MRSPAISYSRKDLISNQDSKSPAMSRWRKDLIINQDSNRFVKEKDQIILPLLEKYPTGYKHYLMIHIIQIKQKKDLIILQIIHVLILMIISINWM